jgi:hypothetical protein
VDEGTLVADDRETNLAHQRRMTTSKASPSNAWPTDFCIRSRNENDLWGRADPPDLGAALIVRQSPKLTVSSIAHWVALHVAECQGALLRAATLYFEQPMHEGPRRSSSVVIGKRSRTFLGSRWVATHPP